MSRLHRIVAHLVLTVAIVLALTAGVWGPHTAIAAGADTLYIGDAGDNTVKQWSVPAAGQPGVYLGPLVKQNGGGLRDPRGLLVNGGEVLVASQNTGPTFGAGAILRYDLATGDSRGALVASKDTQAPFAPRGVVLTGGILIVASVQGPNQPGETCPPLCPDGTLSTYSAESGVFLGNLPAPDGFAGRFHPRGVVIGPDGNLYVAVRNLPEPCGGSVLRYAPPTPARPSWNTPAVFITNPSTCGDNVNDLHRPEGLVFGPDGRLYVTSFQARPDDTDKILIVQPSGRVADHIDLDQVGQQRTYAQALLFGPAGKLFVPITTTGEVRRYDVATKRFDSVVAAGTLGEPWYLTFGRTDPATLAYK